MMKKKFKKTRWKKGITFIFVMALMSFTSSTNWYNFKQKDIGFSIDFSGDLSISSEIIEYEGGEINMTFYSNTPPKNNENYLYMVINSEYPKQIHSDHKDRLDSFFRKGIDAVVKNSNGKILSEISNEINGYLGRKVVIDVPEREVVLTLQIYLVKNIGYTLQVISSNTNYNNPSTKHFLNSFKILD